MDHRDIVLVGNGHWGPHIARNLESLGRLGMIVDLDAEIIKASQKQYPQVQCTQDLQLALRHPSMKAFFIATPPGTHSDLAMLAMRAGKDVFVEKPMADSLEQARLMLQAAKETDRILMVGHILLYHPVVQTLKKMIESGEIGKIQYIYSNRLNFGQIRIQENTTWSFAPHDIAVMNYLLQELPIAVRTTGSDHLTTGIHDVTLTDLEYPGGLKAHIFVSWLHPYKDQRLVIVGTKKMAVFSDQDANKLVTYDHEIEWVSRRPMPKKASAVVVPIESYEPLKKECEAFLESIKTRKPPLSDGTLGIQVVEVLQACDQSLKLNGQRVGVRHHSDFSYFCHESAFVEVGAQIGKGTKIWHFSHVLKGASIGSQCVLGQNVNVADGALIGNRVKIQNNVSIYAGVKIEDDVFLGPSCVFTNISNPRSQINRHSLYEETIVRRGATIGANATILCGIEIGKYAFVAAGSVVTASVPDYALMMGNPARQQGWMSRHGHRLDSGDEAGIFYCPESGLRYQLDDSGQMKCLDLNENEVLPEALNRAAQSYQEFKKSKNESFTKR